MSVWKKLPIWLQAIIITVVGLTLFGMVLNATGNSGGNEPPAATSTPKPTKTPKPTNTAKPSNTPKPTATTPPTATPKPGAAPTATPDPNAPTPAGFSIAFIDVGQGDAILITIDGHRLLIDGGPSGDRLRDRLRALGVDDLDAILITNPDADHVRGLTEALAMFQIETFYWSGSTNTTATWNGLLAAVAAEPGIQTVTLARSTTITLGNITLLVLNPATLTGDRNVDSLALDLTCGSVTVYLMGDATETSEAGMLRAGLIHAASVVKAGHHGSDTSSGAAFVAATHPQYVVFSAGLNSQYGHPKPAIVSRYEAAGATAIRTDTTGGDDTQILTSDCQSVSFAPAR